MTTDPRIVRDSPSGDGHVREAQRVAGAVAGRARRSAAAAACLVLAHAHADVDARPAAALDRRVRTCSAPSWLGPTRAIVTGRCMPP